MKIALRRAQQKQAQAMVPPRSGRCNAILASGKRCARTSGLGTTHTGIGPCHLHQTAKKPYDPTRRYREAIEDGTIRARLSKLGKTEDDLLDLMPEVQMVRALIIDFINRYDELTGALIEWNREKMGRPAAVPDITQAASLLEMVTRMVERIHRIQTTGAISLDTFRRVLEEMGITVARHVRDGATLDKIEGDWAKISTTDRGHAPALPEMTQNAKHELSPPSERDVS
jgi:adenylosuccinate synthase